MIGRIGGATLVGGTKMEIGEWEQIRLSMENSVEFYEDLKLGEPPVIDEGGFLYLVCKSEKWGRKKRAYFSVYKEGFIPDLDSEAVPIHKIVTSLETYWVFLTKILEAEDNVFFDILDFFAK